MILYICSIYNKIYEGKERRNDMWWRKNGISLIVLIVTIIVIIILAAVVILTLSKNNPIDSAKEATFKEDARVFQDELAMYIAKDYTTKAGQRDEKISADKYTTDGAEDSVRGMKK